MNENWKGSISRLGVDTGGTFTDFVSTDAHGRPVIHKQLSTPDNPAQAVIDGISHMRVPVQASVIHGSTVATNALLERRGARTALITTAGFKDVLAIGRQNRSNLYALTPSKPEPLVPSHWRFELDERVTATGQILRPPDLSVLASIAAQIEADQIESVAISFLFSFLQPQHEQLVARSLISYLQESQARLGHTGLEISLSSDILPEFREYERTSTTVINAYVAPIMRRYLSHLEAEIRPRSLTVMQNNGGIISAEAAGRLAARTTLSGPAGGVVGANYVAQLAGIEQFIAFDMGGTSTDVALCQGELPLTSEGEIGGLPMRLPMIDIHTVGAGGGSIAFVDAAGALHVGPQSTGADPGPACYPKKENRERTSYQPTTTDANLILGRLDANHFLGGEITLDHGRAWDVMKQLAEAMGAASVVEAALGVIQVANANMERAIRRISVERGHDPREFSLVAFGGAGPLHACDLAESMGIPSVLIAPVPGVLSALGMLVARPAMDFSQTIMWQPDGSEEAANLRLSEVFAGLTKKAERAMAVEGYSPDQLSYTYGLDMRYVGQSYELTVTPERWSETKEVTRAFHRAHERRYGYHNAQGPVEIVNLRLGVKALVALPDHQALPMGSEEPDQAEVGRKSVWFDADPVETRLYDRQLLRPGNRFNGPSIVFQYDTTTVIPPGWSAFVDDQANLILTRD